MSYLMLTVFNKIIIDSQIQTKVTLKLQMKIQDPPQFLYHIQLQPQLQVTLIQVTSTAVIFALPFIIAISKYDVY